MIATSKKFKLAFIIFIFLISSCKNRKEVNSNITKVTVMLPKVECDGNCPFEIVSLKNDLSLEYFGNDYAKRKGFYRAKVNKEIWDSVSTKFNKFLFLGIDSTGLSFTDFPNIEFIIYEGQKRQDFKINAGSLSKRDRQTLYWFSNKVLDKVELKSSDSIDFRLIPMSPPPFPASKSY